MKAHSTIKPREPWLMVRHELSGGRRVVLMALSFVTPVVLWCVLTYVPWFHRDVKLQIAAAQRRDASLANFTAGDRVAKDYFADYAAEVRQMNEAILTSEADATPRGGRRANTLRLRQLQPLAVSNGWLPEGATAGTQTDELLLAIWGDLAEGRRVAAAPPLTDENMRIITHNWTLMNAEAGQPPSLPDSPLLHLVPQGVSASPVFLPSPGECIRAAMRDFTTRPGNGEPMMHERLFMSLRVVFGGFLMACAIGVPLGLLCGSYDLFAKLTEPFTDFFRYMPAPTFSLLLVAAFGVEQAPKTALVFIGTFPHMVLMLANTTRLLDRSLLEAAQTLGASRKLLLTRVVIPGIMPKLYSDLRVLLGWAWTWLVIAELIGTKTGLTAFIDTQGGRRNFDRVFPVIIMIGVIGFLTDQVLQMLARRLFPWEYTQGKRGFFATLAQLRRRPARTTTAPTALGAAHAATA